MAVPLELLSWCFTLIIVFSSSTRTPTLASCSFCRICGCNWFDNFLCQFYFVFSNFQAIDFLGNFFSVNSYSLNNWFEKLHGKFTGVFFFFPVNYLSKPSSNISRDFDGIMSKKCIKYWRDSCTIVVIYTSSPLLQFTWKLFKQPIGAKKFYKPHSVSPKKGRNAWGHRNFRRQKSIGDRNFFIKVNPAIFSQNTDSYSEYSTKASVSA